MTITRRRPSVGIAVLLWALRIGVALFFLLAAVMKLSGQPMMVSEFAEIGLGQWLQYLTGVLEFAGAVAVLVPRVSVLGAILLLLIDVGALVAQLGVLHKGWIHVIVVAIPLVLLIWLQANRASDPLARQ